MKSKKYYPKMEAHICLEKCQARDGHSSVMIGSWYCKTACPHSLEKKDFIEGRDWILCDQIRKATGRTSKKNVMAWVERHPTISYFLAISLTIAVFISAMWIIDLIFLK